jgi:hypothetical protein
MEHKGYIDKNYAIKWDSNLAAHLSAFSYGHLVVLCDTADQVAAAMPSASAPIGLGVSGPSVGPAGNRILPGSRLKGSAGNDCRRLAAAPGRQCPQECLLSATSGSWEGHCIYRCVAAAGTALEESRGFSAAPLRRGLGVPDRADIAETRRIEASTVGASTLGANTSGASTVGVSTSGRRAADGPSTSGGAAVGEGCCSNAGVDVSLD